MQFIDKFYKTSLLSNKSRYWLDWAKNTDNYDYMFGVGRCLMPSEILFQDQTIKELIPILGNMEARVLKTPPGYGFDWHIDPSCNRQCALNLLLTPGIGSTLFQEKTTDYKKWIKITELVYSPDNWYLLNTQVTHCYMNTDFEDRYVLSIEIESSSYSSVLEKLRFL
jgi:hypothetical protein